MSRLSIRHVLVIAGLIIGLLLGLWYTWFVDPVQMVNTRPLRLRNDYRHDWIRLVALSYVADGDLERARVRLEGIEQTDIESAIPALIEQYVAASHPVETLRSLSVLAQALGAYTPVMSVYLDTPASPSPAPSTHTPTPPSTHTLIPPPTHTPTPPHPLTPSPSPTPPDVSTPSPSPQTSPTPTSTPSLLSRLQLAEQEQICQPGQRARIEVVVKDERGRGLTGVEVWLMWSGGADRAVTGLKPQHGAGYADFDAEWGTNYSLGVGELGRSLVTALRLEPCSEVLDDDGEALIGSWRIVLEPRSP